MLRCQTLNDLVSPLRTPVGRWNKTTWRRLGNCLYSSGGLLWPYSY